MDGIQIKSLQAATALSFKADVLFQECCYFIAGMWEN